MARAVLFRKISLEIDCRNAAFVPRYRRFHEKAVFRQRRGRLSGFALSLTESAATLSLSAAVKEAQGKNPEITFLRERLQSMRARANQAPYLEDPEIALQIGRAH